MEDSLSPPPPLPSSKFRQALSGFAYSATGPSTRGRNKRIKLEEPEVDDPVDEVKVESVEASPAKRKTSKQPGTPSPRKQKPIQKELEVPHAAPPHWRETYDLIKEMRKDIVAPVDTMGCATSMTDEVDEQVCSSAKTPHSSTSNQFYIESAFWNSYLTYALLPNQRRSNQRRHAEAPCQIGQTHRRKRPQRDRGHDSGMHMQSRVLEEENWVRVI